MRLSRIATRVFFSMASLAAMQARAEPIAFSRPAAQRRARADGRAELGDLVAVGQPAVDAALPRCRCASAGARRRRPRGSPRRQAAGPALGRHLDPVGLALPGVALVEEVGLGLAAAG